MKVFKPEQSLESLSPVFRESSVSLLLFVPLDLLLELCLRLLLCSGNYDVSIVE